VEGDRQGPNGGRDTVLRVVGKGWPLTQVTVVTCVEVSTHSSCVDALWPDSEAHTWLSGPTSVSVFIYIVHLC
jgi:hypothetical protein